MAEEKNDEFVFNTSATFAEQVDGILNGNNTTNSHLEVLKATPPLLRMVGVPNLPMLITARHVKTMMHETGEDTANYHGLGADIVKRLPDMISDPVMIMDSLTRQDSIVVVTSAVDKENRPVIGAIKLNGYGNLNEIEISANILKSAYGKDNFNSFVQRNIDAGKMLYWNKEKSQELFETLGLQLPDNLNSLDSDTIIRKTNAFVKTEVQENKEITEKKEGTMQPNSNNSAQDKKEWVQKVRDDMVKTLLEYIEKNPTNWQSGWNNIAAGAPYNGKTTTAYRGLNALYLAFLGAARGYKDPRWVTFNQAKELGASVKKGEKSSPVVFFEFYDRATKKTFNQLTVKDMTEEEKKAYIKENVYAVLKYSSVFNAEQCHNFPQRDENAFKMSEEERANQNTMVETIIGNSAAPVLYDGGSRAFYSPGEDKIHLPMVDAFDTMQDYYATALHEIAHSTGHESRLNRDLSGGFGSESYAKEELRAELACVFMQIEHGIQLEGKHITNHAAYLNSWLEAAKKDTSVFFKAAADAQKIADYVSDNYLQSVSANVIEDDSTEQNETERNPMAEYLRAESDKEDAEQRAVRVSVGLKENIKEWYTSAFPTDGAGKAINAEATFKDLQEQIKNADAVYGMLANDSVVRERTFARLAELREVDYETVYSEWLGEPASDQWINAVRTDSKSTEAKLTNARAQALMLAKETGEPYVTIEWTEKGNGFPDINAYDVMSLSAADKKLRTLDAMAASGEGNFKTKLHIDYVFEGEADAYESCRFNIGGEQGGLVHHIEGFLNHDTMLDADERKNLSNIVEYFKEHLAISEYLSDPEKLAELSKEEQADVNKYVARGRDVLNSTVPFLDYKNYMPMKPEEIKTARDTAHEAGLPFYEGTEEEWESFNDVDGLVYDGNMSVEDYKRMWELREQGTSKTERTEEAYAEQSEKLIFNRFKELSNKDREFFESFQEKRGGEPKNSPWGDVLRCKTIANGIYEVSVPYNGGIMVWSGFAENILSPEALHAGLRSNDCYCFQEDGEAFIALRELYDKGILKPTDDYFTNYRKVRSEKPSIGFIPFSEASEEEKTVYFEEWNELVNSSLSSFYPQYWEARKQAERNSNINRREEVQEYVSEPVQVELGPDIYRVGAIFSNNQPRELEIARGESKKYAAETGEPYITIISSERGALANNVPWLEPGQILPISEADEIFKSMDADFAKAGRTAEIKLSFDFMFEDKDCTYNDFTYVFGAGNGSITEAFQTYSKQKMSDIKLTPEDSQLIQEYAIYFTLHAKFAEMERKAIADKLPEQKQHDVQSYVLAAREAVNTAVPFAMYKLPKLSSELKGKHEEKSENLPHYEISFSLDYGNEMLLTNKLKELGYERDSSLYEVNQRNDSLNAEKGAERWLNAIRYVGADGKSFEGFYGRTYNGIMLEATNIAGFTTTGLTLEDVTAVGNILLGLGADVGVREISAAEQAQEGEHEKKLTLEEARNAMLDAHDKDIYHYAVKIENEPYTDPEDGYETEKPAQNIYVIDEQGRVRQWRTKPFDAYISESDLPYGYNGTREYERVEYEELERIAEQMREPMQAFMDVLREETERKEEGQPRRSDSYYETRAEHILNEHYNAGNGVFVRNLENPRYLNGTLYLEETYQGDKVLSITKDTQNRNIAIIKRFNSYRVLVDYDTNDSTWDRNYKHIFDTQQQAEEFRAKEYPAKAPSVAPVDIELKALGILIQQKGQDVAEYITFEGSNYLFRSENLAVKYGGKVENGQIVITPELEATYNRLKYEQMTASNSQLGREYAAVKQANPDSIVFYRIGDFYEVLGEDARRAAEVLDLTLTGRMLGDERVSMAGIPFHAMEEYAQKLAGSGENVVVAGKEDGAKKIDAVKKPAGNSQMERRISAYATSLRKIDVELGYAARPEEYYRDRAMKEIAAYEQSEEYKQAVREDFPKDFIGDSPQDMREIPQNKPVQGNGLAREWYSVEMPDGAVAGRYGENTMIKMPKGEFSNYTFFIPTKLIRVVDDKKLLRIASDYKFRLNNDGLQVELTGQELKDSFAGKYIDKTYKRVAPRRKFARGLENLEKNVPTELKEIPAWCCYRTRWNPEKGKKDKFIISTIDGKWTSSKEPNKWVTFDAALKYARENDCEGLSLLLDKKYGITCIDLDKCYLDAETGEKKERATKLIEELKGTYIERSTSGNGIHIFIKDDILKNGIYNSASMVKDEDPRGDLEVFDDKRIISMTGDMLSEGNELTRAGSAATVYLRQELGEARSQKKFDAKFKPATSLNLSDSELINWIKGSKQGGKFNDLMAGKGISGDKSADDAKLAHMLLYFSGGDKEQTFRIMRESGLYRPDKPDSYYYGTITKMDAQIEEYAKRPNSAKGIGKPNNGRTVPGKNNNNSDKA